MVLRKSERVPVTFPFLCACFVKSYVDTVSRDLTRWNIDDIRVDIAYRLNLPSRDAVGQRRKSFREGAHEFRSEGATLEASGIPRPHKMTRGYTCDYALYSH